MSDPTEAPKMEITAGEVGAIGALVGAAQFEIPYQAVIRLIAEATEVLIRRRVRQEQFPEAVYIEDAAKAEPERVLVVPLHGDIEEQQSRIQEVIALFQPFDDKGESVELAARITAAALDIALSRDISPELAEQFIRSAIRLAKDPHSDADADVHVVCLERFPSGTEGDCIMCGEPTYTHKVREPGD